MKDTLPDGSTSKPSARYTEREMEIVHFRSLDEPWNTDVPLAERHKTISINKTDEGPLSVADHAPEGATRVVYQADYDLRWRFDGDDALLQADKGFVTQAKGMGYFGHDLLATSIIRAATDFATTVELYYY